MNLVKHKDKLFALEKQIKEELEEIELEVEHHYAEGTYTRVLKIPKGVVLTGKIHRYSCVNILAQGKIRVVTDEGHYDLEAPYVFVSGPLVKKAGYALEDTIWINVHPWDGEMNLEQIENEVIVPPDQLEYEEKKWLGQQ